MRLCEFFSESESWDNSEKLSKNANFHLQYQCMRVVRWPGSTSWPIVRIGTVKPGNSS